MRKRAEHLLLPLESLAHAFASYSALRARAKSRGNLLAETQTDNEYEKQLLTNVIPSEQIGVTFGDIGALFKVKNTLFELVILPLVRPELFVRGNLTKPLKGVYACVCLVQCTFVRQRTACRIINMSSASDGGCCRLFRMLY